ncbi:hypothetical protein BH09PLA1_BH09PLA1_32810 [soil metagenome]
MTLPRVIGYSNVVTRGPEFSEAARRFSVARRAAIARGLVDEPRAAQRVRPRESDPRPGVISAAVEPGSVRDFARHVALATTGPFLRYSQRLQLFGLATQAGISRFDANLIIAAIEHRAGRNRTDVQVARPGRALARPSVVFSAAAAVQVVILFVGWIMLMH